MATAAVRRANPLLGHLPHFLTWRTLGFRTICSGRMGFSSRSEPESETRSSPKPVDRPIRPLFPAGFFHEVQVMASVLSSDGKQDPDVMAANATSAALMLSDIPWAGPIGMIRIGRIEGKFIVNPTTDELSLSDLNLVYACTREKTLMIDVQAREISERDLEAGLRLAHPEAVKYIEPQIRLAAKAGKQKKEYKLSLMPERTLEKVARLAEAPIEEVFADPKYGKFERGEALENIAQDVKKALEEECDEESLRLLPKAVDTVRKKVVRKRIIAEGSRLDGRRLDEVRPVYCESGILPTLHGSSLFSRGDTQVLCTVTLGALGDAQRLESVVDPPSKRFMLHYSFPPFCINEVGKHGGLNRREVGHGTLAEKALLAVLPPEEEFPYTVRINSEVMASDGSTSMASVCGGSMALMDAGIPLRKHVAGISVALVSEVDQSTGTIKEYRILTDILGLEDHLGDMDFKIVGTQDGVTAIQLDIKPGGIPLDIVCESLEAAHKGRIQILDHMEREISAPRTQDDRNSPRLVTLKYSNDALRSLLGPMGSLKRKIEDETGTRMSVSDGTLTIVAKNQSAMDEVLEKVDFILGCEIEIGGIYKGTVASIKEYGAFVEFNGGQQGLLHISEFSHEPVSRISDVVSVGQQLSLMCIGQDVRGNISLSLKATSPRPQSQANNLVESVLSTKQSPTVWATAGDVSTSEEKTTPLSEELPVSKYEVNNIESSSSSSSPVLVRSVEECDEEERSTGYSKTTSEPVGGLKPERKTVQTTRKASKSSLKKGEKAEKEDDVSSQTHSSNDLSSKEDRVTARILKLGTKAAAKVYQVRTGGLVLDLGGRLRGMYRFEMALHTHSTGNGLYLEDVKHTASVKLKKFYLGDVLEEIIWRIHNGIESGCLDTKRMPIIDNQVFLADDPYRAGKYSSYLDSVTDFIKDFHQPDVARMTPREVQLYQDFTLYVQKTTQVRHLELLRAHPHLHTSGQELLFIPAALDQLLCIPENQDGKQKHFPALLPGHHNSPVELPLSTLPPAPLMRWELAYIKMVKGNGRKVDIKSSVAHLPEFEAQRNTVIGGHRYINSNAVHELRYCRNVIKHIQDQYPSSTEVEDMEVLKKLWTVAPTVPLDIFQFFWCYDGHARGTINLNFIYQLKKELESNTGK